MIIIKKWLNEWIDVSDISSEKLCEIFNSIGLEVDNAYSIKMPDLTVVGYVKEKNPHPNADKLSVCKVDVGDKELQIVCGAKNVAKGQFVPVALEGALLPNDIIIKSTFLRDVQSNGMICSSVELGLPKLNDGIMVLDESLGKLKAGLPLKELFDDEIIELELTANRGDCLSIRGIARDLKVVLDRKLKNISNIDENENILGIGRILAVQIEEKLNSKFIFKVLEYENMKENILMELRLKIVGFDFENPLDCLINYAIYSTGVLFRVYDAKDFIKDDFAEIKVLKNDKGFDEVRGLKPISLVGYKQFKKIDFQDSSKLIILESSYIKPDVISKLGMENKNIQSDFHYYRSSRGSEPDLAMGINYIENLITKEEGIKAYGGFQNVELEEEEKIISFEIDKALGIIGQDIAKNDIVNILKGLGFDVVVRAEQEVINIGVPPHRHDINDTQDICEEIVRIVGIDNIKSKPCYFAEKLRHNQAYENYKKAYDLRMKSVGVGFFESIHYVFDDKEKMEQLGLKILHKNKDILNPITKELNTLRSTLALHLIEATSNNAKNSRSSIALFEIGKVFDAKREEISKIAWIFSGLNDLQNVQNHGKPEYINFALFVKKISQIIGDFELIQNKPDNKLFSPFEYASVKKDGVKIGYIGRIHAKVEDEYKIAKTYFCEIDFDALKSDIKEAKAYSKYPISTRELSLLIPKNTAFSTIKKVIIKAKSKNLIKFYPIDLFESEELGKNASLSVKFVFQGKDETLSDEDINESINKIQEILKSELNIGLR